jgi:hypothetical protein
MIPLVTEEVLRFMLFLYLANRIWWDILFKFYRWIIGGGNK